MGVNPSIVDTTLSGIILNQNDLKIVTEEFYTPTKTNGTKEEENDLMKVGF